MTDKKPLAALLILLFTLLAACAPMGAESGTDDPATTPESASGAGAATTAAVAQLASDLGISAADIEVISSESTAFTDSCLGLGQANESCLQAITPGWLVVLSAGGQEYRVHTDETAQQVRVAPTPQGEAADPEAATAAAIAFLAAELGVAEADIEMVSLEGAEFSDSCLGLGQANESCLQAITPGWLVILSAGGQEYEVHTDATGQQVRVAGE